MCSDTKEKIAEAVEQMMLTKPVSKITVQSVMEQAQMKRQTFYYHYQDIYALLEVWLKERLAPYSRYDDWKEAIKAFLKDCREKRALIYHLYDCLSRDILVHSVFTMNDDAITRKIREYSAGGRVSEETIWELTFMCRYVVLGFFTQFLWNRMEGDVDRLVDRIAGHLEDLVRLTLQKEGALRG